MHRRYVIVPLVAACSVSLSQASTTFTATTPILSIVQDTSNLRLAETSYQMDIAPSSDVYINSVSLVPGVGYDNNLGLNVPAALYYSGPGSGTLTQGVPLSGGSSYHFYDILDEQGARPSVPVGTYNFSLEFTGGDSPSSSDVLGDVPLQVEVVNKIDASASAVANPSTISPGQTTTISATLTNNMTDRNFVVTTTGYFGPGMTDGAGHSLVNANFLGNWNNQTIAPGDSRTDNHTSWQATAASPNGTYVGDLFIQGGLYAGDGFDIPVALTVTVIPEPAAGVLLMLPAIVFACRTRRRA